MLALALVGGIPPSVLAQLPAADANRLAQRIDALAQYGRTEQGGVSRLAFSDADIAGRSYIIDLMTDLGLEVRIDSAGNIFGRRPGQDNALPPILFGSHIDTVPNGGKYDGPAGVLTAIEVVELLDKRRIATHHPLEVVVFAAEEVGQIGAKGLAGSLQPSELEETAQSGFTLADGIARIGGDPAAIERAAVEPGDYTAYLELHVEQGPVLADSDIDIGVVQGIVGIQRWYAVVTGEANHAGTTPMDKRRDALVTASKFVLSVNRLIRDAPGRQVGTVGRIRAFPGAPNVVPGRVEMTLEIRDLSASRIERFFEEIKVAAQRDAQADGTAITFRPSGIRKRAPAETDPRIRDFVAAAARARGYSYRRMPSGAGHDAQTVSLVTPIGMIFVPSNGGMSHTPEEFTSKEDLAKGANVLLDTLLTVDKACP